MRNVTQVKRNLSRPFNPEPFAGAKLLHILSKCRNPPVPMSMVEKSMKL